MTVPFEYGMRKGKDNSRFLRDDNQRTGNNNNGNGKGKARARAKQRQISYLFGWALV
jgi:hypothetical protein